jgi:hypothetical protein
VKILSLQLNGLTMHIINQTGAETVKELVRDAVGLNGYSQQENRIKQNFSSRRKCGSGAFFALIQLEWQG